MTISTILMLTTFNVSKQNLFEAANEQIKINKFMISERNLVDVTKAVVSMMTDCEFKASL